MLSLPDALEQIGRQAAAASRVLAQATTAQKNRMYAANRTIAQPCGNGIM